jgi:hypothetical protein
MTGGQVIEVANFTVFTVLLCFVSIDLESEDFCKTPRHLYECGSVMSHNGAFT